MNLDDMYAEYLKLKRNNKLVKQSALSELDKRLAAEEDLKVLKRKYNHMKYVTFISWIVSIYLLVIVIRG